MKHSSPILPKVLKRSRVARSRFFEIESLQLQFSNGQQREFERLRGYSHGAVMIVPFLDKDTILLIREYAAGTHTYELGFPKGLIDPGETAEAAAHRELQEEVGFAARNIQKLQKVTMSPSYFGSEMTLFMAFDLHPKKLAGDEPEPLQVIKWPLSKIEELLARDDFREARGICALLLAQKALKDKK